MLLEERETRVQIGRRRDDRAERNRVEPGEPGRIFARAPAGTYVGELLEHLDRRRRLDGPVGVRGEQAATRLPKRMLLANSVSEHRRVEDDHAGRSRAASSSWRRIPRG